MTAISAKNTTCTLQKMNVSQIRYTQNTISDKFSDGRRLQSTINMLKTKKINADNIPPIRVGLYRGHYTTVDNRRLYCFKSSNVEKIPVKYISADSAAFYKKNTSKNDGQTVRVRNEKRKTNANKRFYCNLCDVYVTSGNKTSHLKGRRHHKNAAQKRGKAKEAELVGTKSITTRTKSARTKAQKITKAKQMWKPKICTVPVELKSVKTKLKEPERECKLNCVELGQIISEKTHEKNTANKKNGANKENGANKKNGSNKKNKLKKMARECKLNCVEDVIVISWKPVQTPICAVGKAGETELEQIISAKSNEINDLNSKLKEKEQEINAYRIKLKDMEQCSDVAIDIDVDVDVEANEEMKKNNCASAIAPMCCVFGLGFGALCLYFAKYI